MAGAFLRRADSQRRYTTNDSLNSEEGDNDDGMATPAQHHSMPLTVSTTGIRAVATASQPAMARLLLAADALVIESVGGTEEQK